MHAPHDRPYLAEPPRREQAVPTLRAVSRRLRLIFAALCAVAAAAPSSALAQDSGGNCLTADPPPPSKAPQPLRFGITPQLAGSAGVSQGEVAPVDEAAGMGALRRVRPEGREMVMRLNRLFWSEGEVGIRSFVDRVDAYAREGFPSEVQIRYHPAEGQAGKIGEWVAFVRSAVRALAARPAVVALSITNEANLPISPNTSDGAYAGVLDALIEGVVAARRETVAMGRGDLPLGFTFAWRWSPDSDARFWTQLGEKGTDEFRRALSYVGLQVYPGLVWPPAPLAGRTAGREVVEALTLVRRCYMPKAKLGDGVALWVSENGYATNLGRDEAGQAVNLDSTVRDVHAWSGELGVTDFRYFNLRDNDSDGDDLFDAVGLLRDDYSEKPAFAGYRGLVGLFGRAVEAPAAVRPGARRRPSLVVTVSPARDRRGTRRFVVRGRLVLPAGEPSSTGCGGRVTVRFKAGRRTISSRSVKVAGDCRLHSAVRFRVARRFAGHRRLRILARFEGSRTLVPARAPERRVRVR